MARDKTDCGECLIKRRKAMPYFTTKDGCKLHYEEAGSGKPLVLIHGWSQCAEMFKKNIPALSKDYRVIALDLRGHGDSEKPTHGYRISRLAKDVYEFVAKLELQKVNLLGWSMGCSIIWSYCALFGPERLEKLILVDEPPWLLNVPGYDQGILKAEELASFCDTIRNDREAMTKWFVDQMVSTDMPQEEKDWIATVNQKMPAQYAGDLLFIHCSIDWRDTIPLINLPTLVIGGKKSLVPWQSQVWIHEHIPGSKLEIFEERGHIMFYEEPDKFNRILADFIG